MFTFSQDAAMWKRGAKITLWFLLAIIAPVIAFFLSEFFVPEWKGGARFGTFSLLIQSKLVFMPLVFWASIALAASYLTQQNATTRPRVVIGLWLGLIVSLFSLVSGLLVDIKLIVFAFAPFELLRACFFSHEYCPISVGNNFLEATAFYVLSLTPWYTPALYGFALKKELQKSSKKDGWKTAGVSGVITLPFVAAALVWAEQLYRELPTKPPECYVATAATGAHPRLLKTLHLANGSYVSRQLIILKAFEFWWKEYATTSHMAFRIVYDRIGPPLANVIRKKSAFATLTYLCLTPFAWFAEWTLRLSATKKTNEIQ